MTEFEQEELAADLVSSFMIPELHRLYHNSRVDAAGARFTKASEQVVDAVFSAHPIAKQILDELEPVVDEHIVRGVAAVEGGTKIMDEIIAEAVCVALVGTQPDQTSGSQDTSTTTKSESTPTTEATKTDSTSTKHTTTSDKDKDKKVSDDLARTPSVLYRPTYGQATLSFQLSTFSVGDDKKEDTTTKEEEQEEQAEVKVKVDEIVELEADGEEEEDEAEDDRTPVPDVPNITICVGDPVVRSLAAKSVQVTYDTEPGQKAEAIYFGASQTVDQLFEEVKRKVITPRVDDSASDATLSDDTDD